MLSEVDDDESSGLIWFSEVLILDDDEDDTDTDGLSSEVNSSS